MTLTAKRKFDFPTSILISGLPPLSVECCMSLTSGNSVTIFLQRSTVVGRLIMIRFSSAQAMREVLLILPSSLRLSMKGSLKRFSMIRTEGRVVSTTSLMSMQQQQILLPERLWNAVILLQDRMRQAFAAIQIECRCSCHEREMFGVSH